MIQTNNKDHPLLRHVLTKGYYSFINYLLKEQQQVALPPFSKRSMLRASGFDEQKVEQACSTFCSSNPEARSMERFEKGGNATCCCSLSK